MSQNLPNQGKQRILVVDDHQLILGGSLNILKQEYPDAEILKAETAQEALDLLASCQLDLVVIDLSIPEKPGMMAQIDTGIQLLKTLMKKCPTLNLVVQSSYIKALVRIKREIDDHEGGFVIANKGLSEKEILNRVNLALQGITHTKDIKTALEFKPEWLEVLKLAFEEGLQDKAIADRMYIHERTVRSYWTKIQDVLGVYPEDCKQEGKNMRIQTTIRAREEGLID
ncbi:response regulator receiver protein [Scytonema hofmannii PCC 7110]|uniref:Response regulator receiver protein n=1 Tax=Scytonema hofmannii PCC 7110 TaxID=128403 RepID=A0A139WSG4_9CYAN|nr:response regulator transcription factor [Scytonema hofmannii]KYC35384.1 response regulator receiver protein [Scytonema hofmannii PCC 7110]